MECVSLNYYSNFNCQLFMKEQGDPGVVLENEATSTYYQCGPAPVETSTPETTDAPTTTTTRPTTAAPVTPAPTLPPVPPVTTEETEIQTTEIQTTEIQTTEIVTEEQPDENTTTPEIETTTRTIITTTERRDALDWLKDNLVETVLIGMGILILLLFTVAICAICILSRDKEERETKHY